MTFELALRALAEGKQVRRIGDAYPTVYQAVVLDGVIQTIRSFTFRVDGKNPASLETVEGFSILQICSQRWEIFVPRVSELDDNIRLLIMQRNARV